MISTGATLVETPTAFVFSSSDGKKVIEIDRVSGVASVSNEKVSAVNAGRRFEFIFGVIDLLVDRYLILCTKSEPVGSLGAHQVRKMSGFDIVPMFSKPGAVTTATALEDESIYLGLLRDALNEPAFYFCATHDITRTLRHRAINDKPSAAEIVEGADAQFWWNKHLQGALVDAKLYEWTLPVVKGFFFIAPNCRVGTRTMTFALLSRRSRNRVGTRYIVRGADQHGNVANEVETEQLVVADDGRATAYVLLRGSIPLRWTQRPDVSYKPKPRLTGELAQMRAPFQRHFDRLSKHYDNGSIVVVNLIDQKGSEKVLGDAFEKESAGPLHYVGFDFHKECKNMRYDRIESLLQSIRAHIETQNHTQRDASGALVSAQRGIVRVNCIDNLDRTNVVQSVVSQFSLDRQLRALGYLKESELSASVVIFEQLRKNVWADNADAISMQYSGTGALKTDYTRTGKRTWRGALADGVNSATRYYLNNFCDGRRQDAYDLLLGVYRPNAKQASPFGPDPARRSVSMLVTFLVLGILMLLLTSYRPVEPTGVFMRLLVVLVWALLVFATWKALLRYGNVLVNKPRLVSAHWE